jgi:ribose transport system permease protein
MSIDAKHAEGVADEPVAHRAGAGRRSGFQMWTTVGPLAVTVLMLVIVILSNPRFLSGGGPGILALQATFILLAALGQACVLNVGSIDLSNAALAVLSAMVLAGPSPSSSPSRSPRP